jgi:hypothetical protein
MLRVVKNALSDKKILRKSVIFICEYKLLKTESLNKGELDYGWKIRGVLSAHIKITDKKSKNKQFERV